MPKPGPRTTYRYSDEFKSTAVRLSQLPGVEVQDVAASLYIHPFMLSRWRKQAREGLIVTKGVTERILRTTFRHLSIGQAGLWHPSGMRFSARIRRHLSQASNVRPWRGFSPRT